MYHVQRRHLDFVVFLVDRFQPDSFVSPLHVCSLTNVGNPLLAPPSHRWGTEKEEVEFVCLSRTSLNTISLSGRRIKKLMQNVFRAFFVGLLIVHFFFLSLWFQLYVAAVHVWGFYEEWTALLLPLPSEHTADSSMETDWVSKETLSHFCAYFPLLNGKMYKFSVKFVVGKQILILYMQIYSMWKSGL